MWESPAGVCVSVFSVSLTKKWSQHHPYFDSKRKKVLTLFFREMEKSMVVTIYLHNMKEAVLTIRFVLFIQNKSKFFSYFETKRCYLSHAFIAKKRTEIYITGPLLSNIENTEK